MKNNVYPINCKGHQDQDLYVRMLNEVRKQQARERNRQITPEDLERLTAPTPKVAEKPRHYERAISYVCGVLVTYSVVATAVAVVLALLH